MINLNNMIPVYDGCFDKVNIKAINSTDEQERKYKNLMIDQLKWISINKKEILEKSEKLYNFMLKDHGYEHIRKRCCNFRLLEEKSLDYQVRNFDKTFDSIGAKRISKMEFASAVNSKKPGIFYTVNKGFIVGVNNTTSDEDHQEFNNVNELSAWLNTKSKNSPDKNTEKTESMEKEFQINM